MNIKIYPIHVMLDNVYIVKGEGVILVDGGDPNKFMKVKQGIENARIKPQDIQLIVLTHGHWDHVGSASEIKAFTGARIILHQQDLHLMVGSPPPEPPGFTPWGRFMVMLLKIATRSINIADIEPDILAGDEDISLLDYGIAGRVVATPGHSPGSMSVVLDSGEAFVGDLAMNNFPVRLTPGLPPFGDDVQMIKESWRKLKSLGVKTIYPAHGKPFPADILFKAL